MSSSYALLFGQLVRRIERQTLQGSQARDHIIRQLEDNPLTFTSRQLCILVFLIPFSNPCYSLQLPCLRIFKPSELLLCPEPEWLNLGTD